MVGPKDQYNIFKSIDSIGDTQYKDPINIEGRQKPAAWQGTKN